MGQTNNYREYNVILWGKGDNIIHYPYWILKFDHLEDDFEYIMFLKFDDISALPNPDIPQIVKGLNEIFTTNPNAFILLTNRKQPPLLMARSDELIYSFCCKFDGFNQLINCLADRLFHSRHFLFDILNHILGLNSAFNKVYIRQLPIINAEITDTAKGDIIIPHKGEIAYLKNLLKFLPTHQKVNVLVGLDQEPDHDLIQLKNQYAATTFFSFNHNPVGPYVIRNWLINSCKGDLIYFQDSDDIPCADRFNLLSVYMHMYGCDWCGSHEVQLDYYNKIIQAIRYPTNVIAALSKGPGHALLLPASAITRRSYISAGTLSEERIFGNDTKFLYQSYFRIANIRNIDEFLYIRRIHPNSLTTSESIGLNSKSRRELMLKWIREFDRVKNGLLTLNDSTLIYKASDIQFYVNKL
jgi:hypothetical protein